MTCTIKYVALDVHQATTVASVREERGRVIARTILPTSEAALRELTRSYQNVVEDSTRVMLRLKALFCARAIATQGTKVYHPRERERWLARLPDRGARLRAEALYAELAALQALRPRSRP